MSTTASEPLAGYAFGHTAGTVSAHASRSAARHAAFLLPYLPSAATPSSSAERAFKILDIGCGPGSITCDLAELVPSGHVTGIDLSPSVLETARSAAHARGTTNTTFLEGDILGSLPPGLAPRSFDLVFCHQLLNHLRDPVGAIHRMRGLCAPGGLVAIREGMHHIWEPAAAALDDMDQILAAVMRAGGALAPGAGRYLPKWCKEAGFDADGVEFTVTGAPNLGKETREKQRRFYRETFGENAALRGKARMIGIEETRIEECFKAAMEWCDNEEAFQVWVCGEVVCRVGGMEKEILSQREE